MIAKSAGDIGPRTLAAFNVPVERRIEQLLVNLERRRWMPGDLGRKHILVNQAAYRLDLVEDGRSQLSMRVVVGKPKHATPIFSDEMTRLVGVLDRILLRPAAYRCRDCLGSLARLQDELVGRQGDVFCRHACPSSAGGGSVGS